MKKGPVFHYLKISFQKTTRIFVDLRYHAEINVIERLLSGYPELFFSLPVYGTSRKKLNRPQLSSLE